MKSVSASIAALVATAIAVSGAPLPDGSWPESMGTVENEGVIIVGAGETFDGKMQTYQRSDLECNGQAEGTWRDAMFKVEAGGTLKNVIIGDRQSEGVHCNDHDCKLENVWWDAVCEDAWTIKNGESTSISSITGGGARNAEDKVVQFNGEGLVTIDGFYVENFGKLARSCGTCGEKKRSWEISNVLAVEPQVSVATVNENYGDVVTFDNVYVKSDDEDVVICGWSRGTEDGEPEEVGEGPKDGLCNYTLDESVFIVGLSDDISAATNTAAEATDDIEVPAEETGASMNSTSSANQEEGDNMYSGDQETNTSGTGDEGDYEAPAMEASTTDDEAEEEPAVMNEESASSGDFEAPVKCGAKARRN